MVIKAFGHYVMSQGAPFWLLWAFYISFYILLFLLFLLLLLLLLEFLSRAVYCSSEVSSLFGFVSFNFFICLNLIHETTMWC